jgi:hypothetical protein
MFYNFDFLGFVLLLQATWAIAHHQLKLALAFGDRGAFRSLDSMAIGHSGYQARNRKFR